MAHVLKNRFGTKMESVAVEKVEEYLNLSERIANSSLFAYPAQCNFSGARFNLDWINQFQAKNWLVLLDAASFASTSKLDLNKYPADYIVLSFYKLFGFPTGVGALLVKKSAASHLSKSFFGGGTMAAIAISPFFSRLKSSLSEQFEDGTIPFQQILALEHGFDYIKLKFGSWDDYQHYCNSLVNDALVKMINFRYPNGTAVFKVFECNPGPNRGPIIAFCLLDDKGMNVGYSQIMKLAVTENIHLRSGRFCNPGAAQYYLNISSEEIKDWKENLGHVCGDSNDLVSGKPTGALRLSFSYVNEPRDIDKFLDFVREYFFVTNLNFTLPTTICDKNAITLKLEDIFIFPIKSCKGFHVRNWKLTRSGLQYDREFMLIDNHGQILTQKKYSKLNTIQIVDLDILNEVLVVGAPDSGTLVIDLKDTVKSVNTGSSFSICGLARDTVLIDSDHVHSWFANCLGIDCYLVRRTSSNNRSFSNNSQYLMVSSSSIDSLKSDMIGNCQHVSPLSFRPNFVFSGTSPFEEESWLGKVICIDGIKFNAIGLCERCNMVNIDDECRRHKEPLRSLSRRPRRNGKIVFGLHLSRESSDSVLISTEVHGTNEEPYQS